MKRKQFEQRGFSFCITTNSLVAAEPPFCSQNSHSKMISNSFYKLHSQIFPKYKPIQIIPSMDIITHKLYALPYLPLHSIYFLSSAHILSAHWTRCFCFKPIHNTLFMESVPTLQLSHCISFIEVVHTN